MPSYHGRRFKITPEERKREIDRMKDIYDNAPDSVKEVLSSFRAHVEDVWPCNRAMAYKLIEAFVEEYQVEFIKYRGTGKYTRSDETKKRIRESRLGMKLSEETKKKIGEHTSARQIGTTYSVSANGKRLGKNSLHDENEVFEQDVMLPVTKTKYMTIVIE